jgi:hypothetical protein
MQMPADRSNDAVVVLAVKLCIPSSSLRGA